VKLKELPWMVTAETLMFTTEISGPRHNTRIMNWAKWIGGWVASYYKNDEIPWCGLFVAWCLKANDIEYGIQNPLSALAWNKVGAKVEPCYGAIMVFSRSGGGHVGFYVSEDSTSYHILGGNQSNQVNIAKVAKSRFVGARWPNGYEKLRVAGRIRRTFDGKLSTNEQ
jgi:uncharacterized protein (TIGR02594 family)